MTGQFFFSLLNPAIALVLATTFFVLWRKRPARRHLLLLALAFTCSGLAFMAQDFLVAFEGPALRILTNALFFVAILAACISALVRAGAPIPVLAFAAISAVSIAGFFWFLLVDPSTSARIYLLNAAYAAFALIAMRRLFLVRPLVTADWLTLALLTLLLLFAIVRPLATMVQAIDINSGGAFRESTYWATVQALTPVLAIAVALVFLVALAAELFGELRSEAERDYLTGLFNRRGFDARTNAQLEAPGARTFQPAIMLVDIDNFKAINDTFGHAVGDEVIAAVAHVLAAGGGSSVVGRTGGEEFALFYPDKRRTDLLAIADRLRDALAQASIPQLPSGHPVTVSIGIHTRHQAEPLSKMMARADQALYCAKVAGKNRAAIAPLPLRTVIAQPMSMAH